MPNKKKKHRPIKVGNGKRIIRHGGMLVMQNMGRVVDTYQPASYNLGQEVWEYIESNESWTIAYSVWEYIETNDTWDLTP